jgi:hypothetical protein
MRAQSHLSVQSAETQERDVNWCVDKEQITIVFVERRTACENQGAVLEALVQAMHRSTSSNCAS